MIIECKCFFQVRSCLKHLFLFYTICWCVVWFFLNIGIWASLSLAPFAFEHTISAIFTFSNRHCIGCNQSKCTACAVHGMRCIRKSAIQPLLLENYIKLSISYDGKGKSIDYISKCSYILIIFTEYGSHVSLLHILALYKFWWEHDLCINSVFWSAAQYITK